MASCTGTIILANPVRQESVSDPCPRWRTVFIYRCPSCAGEVRVRAGSIRNGQPKPSSGAIRCYKEVTT